MVSCSCRRRKTSSSISPEIFIFAASSILHLIFLRVSSVPILKTEVPSNKGILSPLSSLAIFLVSSIELFALVINRSLSCIFTVFNKHEQATDRLFIESSFEKSAKVSVADISQRVFKFLSRKSFSSSQSCSKMAKCLLTSKSRLISTMIFACV